MCINLAVMQQKIPQKWPRMKVHNGRAENARNGEKRANGPQKNCYKLHKLDKIGVKLLKSVTHYTRCGRMPNVAHKLVEIAKCGQK